MNELLTFTSSEFGKVRSTLVNDEVWFVAKDIANILDYSDSEHMTRRLDTDEVRSNTNTVETPDLGVSKLPNVDNSNRTTYINESGLYHAIICSKKPEAQKFRKWVTSEVLPSIRKTGSYSICNNEELTEISRNLLSTVSIINTEVVNVKSDVAQLRSEVELIKNSISDAVHVPVDELDIKGKCRHLYKLYLEVDPCGESALTEWLYKGYSSVISKNILLQSRRRYLDPLEYLSTINQLPNFYQWAISYINQYLVSINKNPIDITKLN